MSNAVSRQRGRMIIDNPVLGEAVLKIEKIPIASVPTGSEQDTSINLPTKCIVYDVWVDVTTAEATGTTKTLDVGLLSTETDGDADGFLDGVSVSALGVIDGKPTFTVGSSDSFYASTTLGAYLRDFVAGTDANGRNGVHSRKPLNKDGITASSVSYTAGSTDFAEFLGDIYILYSEVVST